MQLGKFFVLAATVLGMFVLATGSLLVGQGTSSSATSQTLLNLTGQNLHDGGDRTFMIPVVTRPSAQITITLQSSGVLDIAIFDANGPLTTSGTGQATYTLTIIPTHDTIASIRLTNNGVSPVAFTLNAVETYNTLTPQQSQADANAGYLGLAAGVGLLMLGLAVFMQKSEQLKVAEPAK